MLGMIPVGCIALVLVVRVGLLHRLRGSLFRVLLRLRFVPLTIPHPTTVISRLD